MPNSIRLDTGSQTEPACANEVNASRYLLQYVLYLVFESQATETD